MDTASAADGTPSDDVSAGEILQSLKDAWINERLAPELLPHRFELIECLMGQMEGVEQSIEANKTKEPYRCHVHKMELDRVRYIISNYLRCRLEKIENYALYLQSLQKDELDLLLTNDEREFLERFVEITKDTISSSVSAFLPPGFKILDKWEKKFARPKLDSFVMVRPKEDIEGVLIPDGTTLKPIDLEKDAPYLIRYSSVRKYVKKSEDDDYVLEPVKANLM